MLKNEIIQKVNQPIYSFNSSNAKTKKNKKIQNIPEDSLFNISYPSSQKEIIEPIKINNYINKKNPQINFYSNNNNQEDQRLFFCLNMLGLKKYYSNFIQNNLNFQGFLALTNNDMAQMEIPVGAQKTIQNFILEYLYFGSQYSLEELRQFFLQRKSKVNNKNGLKRNNRRSYSYDSRQQKIKKIIRKDNFQNSINNNNYISINDNLHKSFSVSNKNKINNYSKNILNNTQNNIKDKYMPSYNSKNKINKNKIPHNYNINISHKINKSEGNLISLQLNNFNNMDCQDNMKMNTYSNMTNPYNFCEINNIKVNDKKSKFRMIAAKHISNSNKDLINRLDQVIMRNRQRKNNNSLKVNNSYDNCINMNKNKKNNKVNNNNNLFDNIDNNYINYYSDNNESYKKINNSCSNKNNRITDLNQYTNYINNMNNKNISYINNSLFNNYELNSFYTGNISKITSFNKIIDESDGSIQLLSGSKNNSKMAKYKKFKNKQMKEVNQLLENSSNNERQMNLDKKINLNSEKNRGMIMNNLNNYFIYNNYRADIGDNLIKNMNAKKEEHIKMNNINSNNNLNLQNHLFKNKIKYYRNTNDVLYRNVNSFSNINNKNNSNESIQNSINNLNNSNNIINYFKKNNKNYNEIPFNHSLIKSEKKIDVFNQENLNQFHKKKPEKIYNNIRNNFYNDKNDINNNYSFNNYISEFQTSYNDDSQKKKNNNTNNIYNNINNIRNNINEINSNINNITFINQIDEINNINNINNIKLVNSTNNNMNYNQNNNIFNKITPFQQYNKSSHKWYSGNYNSFHQNAVLSIPRPISNSEVKNRKYNKIKENPLYCLSNQNQENIKNINLKKKGSRNFYRVNLNQNLSKNQLKKVKIGIKKGILKFNNNIQLTNSKAQNNVHNSKDSKNNINAINLINYQNNQINSNFYINNYKNKNTNNFFY